MSPRRPRGRPAPSPRRREGGPSATEAGFTLVELVVAMSLFGLLLALVMAVVVAMGRETVTASNTADNATELRRAYTVLDRQVRGAEALNAATATGGSWYLEMLLAPTVAGGDRSCAQWRLAADGILAQRTFPTSATAQTAQAATWSTVASRIVVPPATTASPPFVMRPAEAVRGAQRLDVLLTARRGSTREAGLDVTFVARNTSSSTVTNAMTTASQVCTQGGRP